MGKVKQVTAIDKKSVQSSQTGVVKNIYKPIPRFNVGCKNC